MKSIRLGLGPLLAGAIWIVPLASLSPEAHRLAGIVVWVVCYWMMEPIPLAATAVLGTLLAAALSIASPAHIAAAFFDPILLLFLGTFFLARLMELYRLDGRMANALLSHPWVGHRPRRLLWALGLMAWLLAMWTSITASVAMLLPIAKALTRNTENPGQPDTIGSPAYLLFLTYAASAGAVATPVGTPPNMIGIRLIEQGIGVVISFWQWLLFGIPIAVVLLISRFAIVVKLFPLPNHPVPAWAYKPVTLRQRTGIEKLVFISQIDWKVLVLFGGGLALGRLMLDTGLAAITGHMLLGTAMQQHPAVLLAAAVTLATLMSELASNTAAANIVIPVLLAGVQSQPMIAVRVAIAATLGTSLGFLLPVSTPANAMVYGSGSVRMRDLVRAGLAVDLAGILAIWLASLWFIPTITG